jgi:uncharacterized NAD(P)/FAD-binding protein YdhS
VLNEFDQPLVAHRIEERGHRLPITTISRRRLLLSERVMLSTVRT